MQNLKHVGRIKNTKKKVLVAYRTLPGDAYYCLVVPTESLEDSYHNAIINLVESPAAQSAYEFAEALDRTQFPDGSRMLPSLHAKGMLLKVSTDQVEMTPTTSTSILLSELNQIIAEQRGVAVDGLSIAPASADKVEYMDTNEKERVRDKGLRTTSQDVNQEVTEPTFDSPESEAKYYRSQADKLAKQAAEMRRKAEELAPTKKKVSEVA
jgi:hypothetical protein